jgi:hypothetical protein
VRRAAGLRAETVLIPAVRGFIEECLVKKQRTRLFPAILGKSKRFQEAL